MSITNSKIHLQNNCDEIQYGYTQSSSKEKVGPKFLRITDIQNKPILWETVPYCEITKEDFKKYKLIPGDIVIARTGASTGTNAVYLENMPEAVFASYLVRIKLNTKLIPLYVYYYLQSDEYKQHIESVIGGSAQPNANAKQLTDVWLPFHNTKVQSKIARILRNLDDKIEVNTQINTILEQLGEILFRRWFVDFEFTDENGNPYRSSDEAMKDSELGEIPEKWSIKPLDKIAHFLNGLALQKYPAEDDDDYLPVIKIKELRNGITEATDKANKKIPKQYIVENGDVLFSWSGSLLVKIWTQGSGALNQHLFKVTSEYPKWYYYHWIKHHLNEFQRIAADKATTMGHIKRNHLSEAMVLVPDTNTLREMSTTMEPILEKTVNNEIENSILSELRDVLLPLLMSGEIRVPVEED